MQIKAADDRQPDVDALTTLLDRSDVDAPTRKRIDQEIRQIRAGAAGERDAAYQIEFDLADSANRVTIHDLRLEVGGRVAQIDHLVINRLLDIWVLESKHFAEGVAINDHGEWTGFFGGRAYGMASPVEQNRKHIAVLEQVFATGLVALPKRFGIATIKPWIRGLVLVSTGARITRPRTKAAQSQVEGPDSVIKADQLIATIDGDFDRRSTIAIAKVVGAGKIERIGRDLAALHRPARNDWLARFGLSETRAIIATRAPEPTPEPEPASAAIICAGCGRAVSQAVIDYCRANEGRLGGRVLCYGCQRRGRARA